MNRVVRSSIVYGRSSQQKAETPVDATVGYPEKICRWLDASCMDHEQLQGIKWFHDLSHCISRATATSRSIQSQHWPNRPRQPCCWSMTRWGSVGQIRWPSKMKLPLAFGHHFPALSVDRYSSTVGNREARYSLFESVDQRTYVSDCKCVTFLHLCSLPMVSGVCLLYIVWMCVN